MDANARNSAHFDNIGNNLEAQRIRRRTENLARGLINPRDRLYHALFIKIGTFYSLLVPKKFRFFIEMLFLIKGLFLYALLFYLHYSFVGSQLSCLNLKNGSWPRDGLLRVQISPGAYVDKYLTSGYETQDRVVSQLCQLDKVLNADLCSRYDLQNYYIYYNKKHKMLNQCYRFNVSDFLYSISKKLWKGFDSIEIITESANSEIRRNSEQKKSRNILLTFYEFFTVVNQFSTNGDYLFEYSREYGLLHLSFDARRRLKIPVKTILLDPNNDKCFGSNFNRFLLKYFLGYDNILMNSIKRIADTDNNLGYMVNVVTGENYKFVPSSIGKGSYLISFVLMFLFTIAISMLLRYCHQQVFYFIVNMLQVMNMNALIIFPLAPLMAVILSLVGLETIMAEFFHDTSITFYIILMVWTVDQFDTICCHTVISQKYWLRFFYLYHFVFYAYYYRFNGQFDMLALAASWFMIQHSMLFFFHHYELPMIEESQDNNGELESYLEEAVQMIVDGIETVIGDTITPENPPHVEMNTNPGEVNSLGEVVSNANRSTRVYIYAAERPFVNVVRDFIRHFHRGTVSNSEATTYVETVSVDAPLESSTSDNVSNNIYLEENSPESQTTSTLVSHCSESQTTNTLVSHCSESRDVSEPVFDNLSETIVYNSIRRSAMEVVTNLSDPETHNEVVQMPSINSVCSNNFKYDNGINHNDTTYNQIYTKEIEANLPDRCSYEKTEADLLEKHSCENASKVKDNFAIHNELSCHSLHCISTASENEKHSTSNT
nr:membralin isoform X2 [Hydra vulgaris]